jgi:hypothetical protein
VEKQATFSLICRKKALAILPLLCYQQANFGRVSDPPPGAKTKIYVLRITHN